MQNFGAKKINATNAEKKNVVLQHSKKEKF